MSCNLLILLRRENEHRDAGQLTSLFGETFLASSRLTPSQDKPRQTAARTSASFSDAAGEDYRIDAIKRSDHRRHLLAHGIAEHLNGEPRTGVCRRGFVKSAHIAADARYSKKARPTIDQNAWIEIAATRAHDHAAARGQSHARVDRLTGFDRGYAGAISKVGDDKSLGQIVSELAYDRFARKTMKPMALDPLQPQFLGNRKYPPDFRQIGMKRGVGSTLPTSPQENGPVRSR